MSHQKNIVAISIFCALLTSFTSYAGVTDCGYMTINRIYVNGARDDSANQNQLLIELSATCNGKTVAYIENTSPAYNSFLSTALTAFSTSTQVRIYVNDSKVNQIAFIELKK